MLSRSLFPGVATVLLFLMLSSSSLQQSSHAQDAAKINQPPFDELELFAFCAGGPMDSYVVQVVQERGTNFTPDSTFIASFPTTSFQSVLKSIKPRSSETPSQSREQAYQLLRQAWDAQRNGRYATADQSYRKALQLAPKSATLHSAYADDLLFSKNYPQAEGEARQSLQLWPDNADAHAMLALSLTAQKQFVDGETEAHAALRIFPQQHSAMLALAVSLPHLHKFNEAIAFLQKIMPVLPNVAELRKLMGISLIETGEVDAGIDQLNSYLKAVPEDAEGHYYLGVGLRLKGSSAEAHGQFLEATRLQPNSPAYEAAAHPDTPVSAPNSTNSAKPEDGTVSGNTYANNFFAFTYQFPMGWAVLSAEAARGMIEIGGNFISTGDPTEQDLKRAARAEGHQLLYVMESRAGNKPISGRTVMVSALEIHASRITAESYVKALGQRFTQTGSPLEMKASPEERAIGGRTFWMQKFLVHTATGTGCTAQFVTTEKGYLLMFSLAAPDSETLEDLEKSLESIRFLHGPS